MRAMVMLVALARVVVSMGCRVGYQLVRQNGRVLLQLQSTNQQLAKLKNRPLSAAQAPRPAPAMPSGPRIGTPAPLFEHPDSTNRQHSLSKWLGRRLLLIFFNTGCGFCQQMASDIAALPFEEKSWPMPLLVSTGNADDNRKMVGEHGIGCPVLVQKQMEVVSKYSVSGTPIGYLIDEQGAITSKMSVGAPALLKLAAVPQTTLSGDANQHMAAISLPVSVGLGDVSTSPASTSAISNDGQTARAHSLAEKTVLKS